MRIRPNVRNEIQWENGIVSEGIISETFQSKKRASYFSISSCAPWPLEASYVLILLSEVAQEQRHSGNRDSEAIVVGGDLCDVENERAYTIYAPHWKVKVLKVL